MVIEVNSKYNNPHISGRDYLKLFISNDVLRNYPKNRHHVTPKQRRIMTSIDCLIEEIKIAQSLTKDSEDTMRFMSNGSFTTDLWIKHRLFSWSWETFFLNKRDDEEMNIRPAVKNAFKRAYDLEQQKPAIESPSSISDFYEKIHSEVPPLSQDNVPDRFELKNFQFLVPQDSNDHSGKNKKNKILSHITSDAQTTYFEKYKTAYMPIFIELLKSGNLSYKEAVRNPQINEKRNELLAIDFPIEDRNFLDAEDRKILKRLQTYPTDRALRSWGIRKFKKTPHKNSGKKKEQ